MGEAEFRSLVWGWADDDPMPPWEWRSQHTSLIKSTGDKSVELLFVALYPAGSGGEAMKKLAVLSAVFFSGLAVAQGLPRFGIARFGQAQFGVAEPALPVPFMPVWATITLAVALWVVAYVIRAKEA